MLIDGFKLEPIKSVRVTAAPFIDNRLRETELAQIVDISRDLDFLKLGKCREERLSRLQPRDYETAFDASQQYGRLLNTHARGLGLHCSHDITNRSEQVDRSVRCEK